MPPKQDAERTGRTASVEKAAVLLQTVCLGVNRKNVAQTVQRILFPSGGNQELAPLRILRATPDAGGGAQRGSQCGERGENYLTYWPIDNSILGRRLSR